MQVRADSKYLYMVGRRHVYMMGGRYLYSGLEVMNLFACRMAGGDHYLLLIFSIIGPTILRRFNAGAATREVRIYKVSSLRTFGYQRAVSFELLACLFVLWAFLLVVCFFLFQYFRNSIITLRYDQ